MRDFKVSKRKMKYRELQGARIVLRNAPKELHAKIGELFEHIEALEIEIVKLEDEARELRRQLIPPEGLPVKPPYQYKKPENVRAPLPERLANMIMGLYGQNMTDGNWERTLRWSHLNEDQARKLAEPIIQSREVERQRLLKEVRLPD